MALGIRIEGIRTPSEENPGLSYGGFNDLRARLALAAGLVEDYRHLDWEPKGLNSIEQAMSRPSIKALTTIADRLQNVERANQTVLERFMCQCDCESELSPEECVELAPILDGLIDKFDKNFVEQQFYAQSGRKLAAMVRKAGELGQKLIFS